MPQLWPFLERDSSRADHGARRLRAGFTLEMKIHLASMKDGETLMDTRTADEHVIAVVPTPDARIQIEISDGQSVSSWTCDAGVLSDARPHHVAIIVDGRPNIILFVIDGVVNDGGEERQFGWGRLSPAIRDVNASDTMKIGPVVESLRLYPRAFTVSEVIGNYRFAGDSHQ